ncbi:hypothetical protein Avbf_13185 [Armadillidium vulgare]|nr:hypothetical protein Avbf_13185 [Armadillidium vulgare]
MPFKSDIWIYFNSKYKQTICNICGQIYKTNENITDLQTHLITKHYFVYKSLKNKPKQSQILREILSGKENIGSSIRPTDSSESSCNSFEYNMFFSKAKRICVGSASSSNKLYEMFCIHDTNCR